MENRPRGREKHIAGEGKDIYKHGEGLGTDPVGGQSQAGRGQQPRNAQRAASGGAARAGGGKLPLILVLAVLLLGGGGAGIGSLLGGGTSSTAQQGASSAVTQSAGQALSGGSASFSGMSASLASLLGGFGNVSAGWSIAENTGRLDTTVAPGARAKRTNILGDGKDTVTLMVYMCGTDLESKYGMGTADLTEMANATLSEKVNIIVFTGGCRQWKTGAISGSVNQIYKVESGRTTARCSAHTTAPGSPSTASPWPTTTQAPWTTGTATRSAATCPAS